MHGGGDGMLAIGSVAAALRNAVSNGRRLLFAAVLLLAVAQPAEAVSCPTTGKPNCGVCGTLTCDTAEGFLVVR